MNPYDCPAQRVSRSLRSWQTLLPQPAGLAGHPLSRARLQLAAAALEDAPAQCDDTEWRRQAALIRRVERQLRLRMLSLTPHAPPCERLLFSLFMLTELTAAAAQREPLPAARAAMDFLLPECCDMLYRTANLLSLEYGVSAAELLQGQAELMPGRPCIAAHRHPYDDVQQPLAGAMDSARTWVSLFLLHAASRSVSRQAADSLHVSSPRARALYAEISLILSEHATQYGGLLGCGTPPALGLVLRAYAHCSLFHDLAGQEPVPEVGEAFCQGEAAACAHLQKARALFLRMTPNGKTPFEAEPLPAPLALRPSKGYIRGALGCVGMTVRRGERLPVGALPEGADFFRYQHCMNTDPLQVPSHAVVAEHIRRMGQDFRSELAPHPVEMLRDRAVDQVTVGR